jgi:uncharacterized RDD family membrane protein YckC
MENTNESHMHQASGQGAAGFWRRTTAFWLDCLLLGLIGMILANVFFDALSEIGGWGRIIGFAVGSAYFALLEGGPGKNQSLGKRVMKIKVVRCGHQGDLSLSVGRAWCRYAVIAVPLVLNGMSFIDLPSLHVPGKEAIFWTNNTFDLILEIALTYLLIFNPPTRQSLHDLFTSTMVVPQSEQRVEIASVAHKHWFYIGAINMLMIVGSVGVSHFFRPSQLVDLTAIQRATMAIDGVVQSSVITGNTRTDSKYGQSNQTWIAVDTTVRNAAMVSDKGVQNLAQAAFSASGLLTSRDLVRIAARQDVTLGIASWSRGYTLTLSPKQWASKIGRSTHPDGHG